MTEHDTTESTIAVKTDTRLAELYDECQLLRREIAMDRDSMHSYAGDRRQNTGRRFEYERWTMTDDEARHATPKPWYEREHAEAIADFDRNLAKLAEKKAEEEQLDNIWRAHGYWSRFFLVRGGHIHSSMHCSTCNKGERPTEFGWLPELSGLTEADAVAEHGALLCTVCFPTAPVEWTNFYEEQEAKKAAEKCPGSGTWDYDRSTARLGYYTGNYGICNQCGQQITVTKTHKLRAHKPA